MARNIHDIYDAILKMIAVVYQTSFLRYIGIERKIKEIQNIELTRLDGKKVYLDFLCLLDDDTLCHIEFQFPKAHPKDYTRFFGYNITAEVRHGKTTETIMVHFTPKQKETRPIRIGKTKCFNPQHFYLGDIDFEEYIQNIK